MMKEGLYIESVSHGHFSWYTFSYRDIDIFLHGGMSSSHCRGSTNRPRSVSSLLMRFNAIPKDLRWYGESCQGCRRSRVSRAL